MTIGPALRSVSTETLRHRFGLRSQAHPAVVDGPNGHFALPSCGGKIQLDAFQLTLIIVTREAG